MKLGDVCTFDRGLTYSKADEVANSSNGVLRSNNIDLVSNTLCLDEIKYIREDIDIPESKKTKKGSILICMANGSKCHLGKVAIIDIEEVFAFGGFMGLITPTETISSKYLYYSLITPKYKKLIASLSDGANINNLKFRDIQDFEIPVPPLPEQDRIVKILDAAFEKIDRLKENAEKGLQEVKNLWEATLREELKPKEGWKKKSLSEICLKITDGSHNPPKGLDHSEYLMLSSKNVRNDRFSFENPRYLSKFDFENEDKRTKVEKGDVFLTIVGAGLGDCCVYNHSDKITLQRSVCVLKPNKATSSRFLMYLLQSSYERIHKESNGAAQKGIYLNQLSQFLVEMPNIEEQRRVEISLDKISTICQTLQRKYEQELAEYEALKQSILRKAFSGEL